MSIELKPVARITTKEELKEQIQARWDYINEHVGTRCLVDVRKEIRVLVAKLANVC